MPSTSTQSFSQVCKGFMENQIFGGTGQPISNSARSVLGSPFDHGYSKGKV
jgi:hypothetical protein